MPCSAIHPEGFKEHLDNMPLDELVQLGVYTRQRRDTSYMGVATQLADAIRSRGTSLIAVAVWSGPRSVYYGYKDRTVKRAIQERGVAVPSRRSRDIVIPATVGLVTAALGGGTDRFKHLLDVGGTRGHTQPPPNNTGVTQRLNRSQDAEELALGVIGWLGRVFNAAGSTIENRSLAVEHPPTARLIPSEGHSNAYDRRDPENRQPVADRLGGLVGKITSGGEPLLSAESAKVLGSVATGIAIGGAAGKHVEGLSPNSRRAPNEARLTPKKIIWVVLIAVWMLAIVHVLLNRHSFDPLS